MTYQQAMLFVNELARIQELCRQKSMACEFESIQSGSGLESALSNLQVDEQALAATVGSFARPQFVAGRLATSRAILAQASRLLGPVLRHTNSRLPSFPNGLVGSIAHTDTFALSVLGLGRQYQAIGIDIEYTKRACSPALASRISSQEPSVKNLKPIELFCLKESVYKCCYALDKKVRSFKQLQLVATGLNTFETEVITFDNHILIKSFLVPNDALTFSLSYLEIG